MKRSIALPVAAGLVALALSLASCSGSTGTGTGGKDEYVSGGTFTLAVGNDPGDLNPFKAVQFETWDFVALTYESLMYIDPDGKQVPWMASDWTENGTTATFTIKDGITCDDGTKFTAQTAADNLNYNADPDNATFSYGSSIDESVSATADGNTLTVTSKETNPFLAVNVGTIAMVCAAGLKDTSTLSDGANSTGLYKLTSVKAGDTYTLTKRDDYTWGPDDVTSDTVGLPNTIRLQVIPDESTRANLLLSGDLNAASVAGADRSRLDAAGLSSADVRNSVGEMLFNERDGRPFSDPLVREALTLALNREEIAPVVADDAEIPAVSLITKSPFLCVADKPNWTLPDTDLDKAAQLLDQAGWSKGADGKRSKNGKPLTIKFIYDAATSSHAAAAELVQKTWNQLGVTTKLSANDAADWSDQLYSTFDWDTGWIQIAPGGPVVLSTFFAGATPEKGGLNFMFVDNPEYNALAAKAKKTADADEACSIWQDAEKELIDRVDVFPLTDQTLPTYQSGAVFEKPNELQPTTIRMLK
ncbi:ABC transporter substrate-binding protein [Microbacterium horticulturae]|uniref:ABC transporter substrate-binding protein n=1 Tax=Microbacterium horticulturae TaxID=3028316 RepID=A0ABY8BWX5_9MICO|nr:ABC transporter substrate-binding protein [Microbacterium sp. KACC 23027]WEG08694.1 ABC transporter substrate-binding protein [Microbacterium sp. KACC 23027]